MKPFRYNGAKDKMIKDAESQSHEFLTDEQYRYTDVYGIIHTTRQFIHYKDWESYVQIHEHKNRHAYEVINDADCKLYFDIEFYENNIYTEPSILFSNDIMPSIKKHYEAYYGMKLDDDDLGISSTNPRPHYYKGETIKWSYHIVVSNGFFVKKNEDIKEFIKYIRSNETNTDVVNAIDLSPYKPKQSFKLPYQSKIDSPEYTQNIITGEFKNHLIKRYKHDEFKGYYECVIKEETIEKYTQKNTKLTDQELDVGQIITDVKENNKGSLKDPLNKKLNKLGNDDLDWHTYFAVMCALKNTYPTIHGKQSFMDWAKLSKKYVKETSSKEWDGLNPRKDARTLKTIDNLLKKKYPNEYRDEDELVNSITKITINLSDIGYDMKTVDSRYCSEVIDLYKLMGFAPRNDVFEVREKTYTDVSIKSHLGTGKTTIIENLFDKKRFDSVLVISPRVMFANKIYADFVKHEPRLKFYKDIKKEARCKFKFIVCQLESLSTLGDEFQLVILDEVESILNQFHSTTLERNFDKISNKFYQIMGSANYVISADAFVMNRSVDILATIRSNKQRIFIDNTYNPYKRDSFYMGNNADRLTKCILDDVVKNKNDRRVIITGSRPHCDTVHEAIRDTGQSCLKINRFTDDDLTTQIRDVDKMWCDYQNVVYTSTITVGVSYDPIEQEKQFDKLFMNFSVNGACVRDMFQASLRARTVKKNQLFYTVYDRYMKMNDDDNIVLLRTFEELYQWKINNVGGQLPEWIVKVWAYNELERVINRMYFKKVIDKYLIMCGYTSYLLPKKVTVSDDIKKHGLFDFDDIDVDYGECDDIYKRICSGEATTLEKLKYLKYDFEVNLIGLDAKFDDGVLKDMFNYYQQNPTYIHRVREAFMTENEKHMGISPYTDNIKDKKKFIDALNKVLGIENAYTETVLEREVLMGVKEYFETCGEEMKKLFMFGSHKEFEKDTEKAIIGSLNTIYNGYIGMEFKFGAQKRKRIDGKRVDITPLIMSPFKKIEKKTVVFDMTGFNTAFKKNVHENENDDEGVEWVPTEYVLQNVPGDEI